MQALDLSNRGNNEDEVSSDFSLIVKVALSIPPRIVPLQAIRIDMRKAWGENYLAINEISPNLFLASFDSHEKMLNVLKRQPWTVGRRDTLLFEWFDPSKQHSQYRFQFLHTTIRLFGIPPSLRSIPLVSTILAKIAGPSDYDQISNASLHKDPLFVPVRAKVDITQKATDRIKIVVSPGYSITIFVHYEKILKICTYCAGFFHNASNCKIREHKLLSNSKDKPADIPFVIFGSWMSQISEIPFDQVKHQIAVNFGGRPKTPSLLQQARHQLAALALNLAGPSHAVAAPSANAIDCSHQPAHSPLIHTAPAQGAGHEAVGLRLGQPDDTAAPGHPPSAQGRPETCSSSHEHCALDVTSRPMLIPPSHSTIFDRPTLSTPKGTLVFSPDMRPHAMPSHPHSPLFFPIGKTNTNISPAPVATSSGIPGSSAHALELDTREKREIEGADLFDGHQNSNSTTPPYIKAITLPHEAPSSTCKHLDAPSLSAFESASPCKITLQPAQSSRATPSNHIHTTDSNSSKNPNSHPITTPNPQLQSQTSAVQQSDNGGLHPFSGRFGDGSTGNARRLPKPDRADGFPPGGSSAIQQHSSPTGRGRGNEGGRFLRARRGRGRGARGERAYREPREGSLSLGQSQQKNLGLRRHRSPSPDESASDATSYARGDEPEGKGRARSRPRRSRWDERQLGICNNSGQEGDLLLLRLPVNEETEKEPPQLSPLRSNSTHHRGLVGDDLALPPNRPLCNALQDLVQLPTEDDGADNQDMEVEDRALDLCNASSIHQILGDGQVGGHLGTCAHGEGRRGGALLELQDPAAVHHLHSGNATLSVPLHSTSQDLCHDERALAPALKAPRVP